HPVFLEELDKVLAGDTAVLTARDAVAAQPAGIKPFADGTGRHLTDFCDLAGGKDFLHGRHSSYFEFAEPSPGPVNAGTRPESTPPNPASPPGPCGCGHDRQGPPALRSAPVVRTRVGIHS